MPKQYETMRDVFAFENRKAGMPVKKAYDQAQSKAAAIYNAKHKKSPVTSRKK